MNTIDIIRTWKDEDYRHSLSTSELAVLPANPAGMVELSLEQMGYVVGGAGASFPTKAIDCSTMTDAVGCPPPTTIGSPVTRSCLGLAAPRSPRSW
jgi:mersacidin/lichenicidin family type 2 lantibiotic